MENPDLFMRSTLSKFGGDHYLKKKPKVVSVLGSSLLKCQPSAIWFFMFYIHHRSRLCLGSYALPRAMPTSFVSSPVP